MKKTQSQIEETDKAPSRHSTKHSSTLNRKYVKRPSLKEDKVKENKIKEEDKNAAIDIPVQIHPFQKAERAAKAKKDIVIERPSAKELKDTAIKEALNAVATTAAEDKQSPKDNTTTKTKPNRKGKSKSKAKNNDRGKRLALAFACATACVAVLVLLVNLNMPDIAVKIKSMENGINASYPAYVPRDFEMVGVTSESGVLKMDFKNIKEGSAFTISEEKSSWDSAALQNNYVKKEWGEDFTVTHEQGITVFMSNNESVWVNGGLLYKIKTEGKALTKKQIRNIVVSL